MIGRTTTRVAALAVGAAVVAALYVTLDAQSNDASAACAEARPRALALDEHVGGEVAAFQIARAPADLSALAFSGATGEPTRMASFSAK
jgi:hypothetical protein